MAGWQDKKNQNLKMKVMEMVKIAIIGTGNMGSGYARMILNEEVTGAQLVAITRIRPERLKMLPGITEKNIPIYQTDEELFAAIRNGELEADAVVIATPHYAHEKQMKEALELGLHVLCDKPSGVYSAQARRMNEAAQESDRVFAMMFNQRTNPVYRKMKEIVEQKVYGELKRVNWIITDWYRPDIYYDSVAWRGTWAGDGGGLLLNQCPHNLDLMQWICGMPKSVQAFCKEGKYHDIQVEDELTAYLEFENNVTGVFYSTTGEASGINRLEISLDNALLVCDGETLRVCELGFDEYEYRKTATDLYAKMKGQWKDVECEGVDTKHQGVFQNFLNCVEGKEELFVEGQEGLKSLLIANAIYLSSWQRRMVDLPESADEEEAFETAFAQEMEKKLAQN